MNIRNKTQKLQPSSTAHQLTEITKASDPMVELQGLLRNREELLRLSLTHYSTALSAIVFPLLFKVVVFDGMALAVLLTKYLKERHRQTLSHDIEVHRKYYQDAKDEYEKFVSDSLNDQRIWATSIGQCHSISEFAKKLDDFYQKNPQMPILPLKNRFFNVLSALAAFSSHESLKPYLKQMTEKTTHLARGYVELHASFLSPDVKSKSFTALSGLIEIAKKDFDDFGNQAFSFASPEFNWEITKYSGEWMSWIVPGSLVVIGIFGKYFIADPWVSRIYNNHFERPFRIPGKLIAANELHSHLNQRFLNPSDVKALNHELIIRNRKLDEKAEASVKACAAIILVVAGITAIGYSFGGYEVYVMTAGACTLITTVVNGYTYFSRSYLRWDFERNMTKMANHLNHLTRDCQQDLWTIIPGKTLLTTQFSLTTQRWKATGYKPLTRYTVRQAIINTLKTFGVNNLKTTLREQKKTDDAETKEIEDALKKKQTAKLIVGADPALLDSMANLIKLCGKSIGFRLNAHFKLSLERYSLLRLLDLQVAKLTKVLACEDALTKIPGVDANKLPENTYIFFIPENYRSLVTLTQLKKIFSRCRVEFLADKLQVIINGYDPAPKDTLRAFIDDIQQKKASLRPPSQPESKDTKVRTINIQLPDVVKPWNLLKRLNFFNRSDQATSVPTIKWKKVNATYPQDLNIKPVRRGHLYGRFFIRFNLPETAFPNAKTYEQAKLKVEADPHFSQKCLQSIEKSAGKLVRDAKGEWFLATVSITMIDVFYGTIKAYAEAIMSEGSKEILYDVKGLELRSTKRFSR